MIVADGMRPPIDKACGEGLMPDGLAALERLGIRVPLSEAFLFAEFVLWDWVRPPLRYFPVKLRGWQCAGLLCIPSSPNAPSNWARTFSGAPA